MKKLFCMAALVAAAWAGAAAQQPATARVMSYNIRNGVGMDDVRNIQRTASVINAVNPDVVAVQEADSVTNRSEQAYILGQLAEATGMHPTFAAAIDYDGGKYGIGILSRAELLSVKRIALPGREEERALVIAEFPGYILANTHLSLTPEDAEASAAIILAEADTAEKPFILCGDFNSYPDSPLVKALTEKLVNVGSDNKPTWPADKPTDSIDYIMVDKRSGAQGQNHRVVDAPTQSDHRPIVADFILPTAPEK